MLQVKMIKNWRNLKISYILTLFDLQWLKFYKIVKKTHPSVHRLFQGFRQGASIGGSLLCWMGSYLTGRTQRVKLDDYLSESNQCHSRVPQGSHLGQYFSFWI
jgi:hypothetical protein